MAGRQEKIVDHQLGMAQNAVPHLELLQSVACRTRFHRTDRGFAQEGSVRDVSVTLETFQAVRQMGRVVNFVARNLRPYITDLMAHYASPCVDFAA